MAKITGTSGPDVLSGSGFDDTISSVGGSDTIGGGDGNDLLQAGDGSDYLLGGAGQDTLVAGDGNDRLFGETGDDVLLGGAGNDYLFDGGAATHNQLNGGSGDDHFQLNTFQSSITVTGGAGADEYLLIDFAGTVVITDFQAGSGGDRFDLEQLLEETSAYSGGNPFAPGVGVLRLVQSGSATLLQYDADGAAGTAFGWYTGVRLRDTVAASLTADNFGGLPPDGSAIAGESVAGTAGPDALEGAAGNDTLSSLGGNDVISGKAGNDLLNGGDGNDFLDGSSGNDTQFGGNGDDHLFGDNGDDLLQGGAGDDWLFDNGVVGNDKLIGGAGADHFQVATAHSHDTLTGGTGVDVYTMASRTGAGGAVITDFRAGSDGDVIDMAEMLSENNIPSGTDPFSASAGLLRLVQSAGTTLVQYDADGAKGSGYGWITAVKLRDTQASSLTADNFAGIPGKSITGTTASESMVGAAYNDTLSSRAGNDTILGKSGDDLLNGGGGNDTLNGGAGHDLLAGGAGADTFVIKDAPLAKNADTIVGFETGVDTIQLDHAVFGSLPVGVLSQDSFDTYFVVDGSASNKIPIYYDADGAGAGAPVLVCTLQDYPSWAASDFVVT